MALRHTEPAAVPFRPAAREDPDRAKPRLERGPQRPAGGIDRGRVPQRALGLGQDPGEPRRVTGQKDRNRLRRLGAVARATGQRQVRDAVRAAPRPRDDVLDLQRHVFGVAIGAAPAPFLEQVFPDLVAFERPLLVFDPGDLRGLQRLHVEPDQLLGQIRHRREPVQPRHASGGGVDPMLQRRGEPALGLAAIVEPGLAVAQVGAAPAAPEGGPLAQAFADFRAAMIDLCQVQDGVGLRILADDGDAGRLRARIDPDLDGLGLAANAVAQADGERVHAVDHRPATRKHLPCALLRARHQGCLAFVEHEYGHDPVLSAPRGGRCYPVRGLVTGPWLAPRPAPLENVAARHSAWARFVDLPILVCGRGFERSGLRRHPDVGP